MTSTPPLNAKAVESQLIRFLSIDGVTGHEAAIAAGVSDESCERFRCTSAIRFNGVNKPIKRPSENEGDRVLIRKTG